MVSFFTRSKKVSDFEIDSKLDELIKRMDCLQELDARLRQDFRQIIKDEIKSILDSRNKKGWWQIA